MLVSNNAWTGHTVLIIYPIINSIKKKTRPDVFSLCNKK